MRYALTIILVAVLATTVCYSHYGYRQRYRDSRRMSGSYRYRHDRHNDDKPTPPARCDPNFISSRCLADCPANSLPILGRTCPNGQKCCT